MNDDNKRPRIPGSKVWHHAAIALIGFGCAFTTVGAALGQWTSFWLGVGCFVVYVIGESIFD